MPLRVLFTTFAARTHLGLQIPLAWSLAQAGHEVCVASQPNLVPAITEAGLLAVPVGSELDIRALVGDGGTVSPFDVALMDEDRLDASKITGAISVYGPIMSGSLSDDKMLADLLDFSQRWKPDIIVWDALTYAGAICAYAMGVPSVRTLFAMDHFSRLRDSFLRLKQTESDPLTAWLQRRMHAFGIPPAKNGDLDELALGTVTVDPLPSFFSVTGDHPRWGVRMANSFGAPVQGWQLERPADGRPRICVTSGISSREFGLTPPPIKNILAGLADLDVEVVVTLSAEQRQQLGALPENVRAETVVPLDVLLPTCDAIVHHFGTGTVTSAIRHGVPQVHVGGPSDLWGETVLASAVRQHGAAVSVPYLDATPSNVRDAVVSLINDNAAKERAQSLQQYYSREDTPYDLVQRFEELI